MDEGHARKLATAIVDECCFPRELSGEMSQIARNIYVEGFVRGWKTREKIITQEDVETWPLKLAALSKT